MTRSAMLRELTLISARFPGQLPVESLAVWADDLERLGFEPVDVSSGGRALALQHAEMEPAQVRFWRLDLGPLIAVTRKARTTRIEQQRQRLDAKALPAPGRTHNDPLRAKATRLTIEWVSRCVSEKRIPEEDTILARTNAVYSALALAQQLGCSISDDAIEAALAAEAIARTLRTICGGRKAA